MGTRGPVPKRAAERRRRNSESKPETITAPAVKVKQPNALTGWHPSMLRWYKSLATSGQAKFFEPSDWEAARFVATAGTEMLNSEKGMSAPGFSTIWSAMNDLMTTEGARRRFAVEVDRKPEGEGAVPEGVASMQAYRESLGGN